MAGQDVGRGGGLGSGGAGEGGCVAGGRDGVFPAVKANKVGSILPTRTCTHLHRLELGPVLGVQARGSGFVPRPLPP